MTWSRLSLESFSEPSSLVQLVLYRHRSSSLKFRDTSSETTKQKGTHDDKDTMVQVSPFSRVSRIATDWSMVWRRQILFTWRCLLVVSFSTSKSSVYVPLVRKPNGQAEVRRLCSSPHSHIIPLPSPQMCCLSTRGCHLATHSLRTVRWTRADVTYGRSPPFSRSIRSAPRVTNPRGLFSKNSGLSSLICHIVFALFKTLILLVRRHDSLLLMLLHTSKITNKKQSKTENKWANHKTFLFLFLEFSWLNNNNKQFVMLQRVFQVSNNTISQPRMLCVFCLLTSVAGQQSVEPICLYHRQLPE